MAETKKKKEKKREKSADTRRLGKAAKQAFLPLLTILPHIQLAVYVCEQPA